MFSFMVSVMPHQGPQLSECRRGKAAAVHLLREHAEGSRAGDGMAAGGGQGGSDSGE